MTKTNIYHITAIRNGSAYGHSDECCDPAGCAAGSEVRLTDQIDQVQRGRLYEIDDDGNVSADVE